MASPIPVRRVAAWTICLVSLVLGTTTTVVTVVNGGAPKLEVPAWVVASVLGVVSETMQPVALSSWVRP